MTDLSVILPCYNEQDNVKRIPIELIKELDKLKLDYEIIAINDGSIDDTYEELKKIQKKYPMIKIVNHEKNRGLASAIKTGINHATGELTVTLDADFTYHPRQIKKLIDRYSKGDVDLVIGSPFLTGEYSSDIPRYRIMLTRTGSLLYSVALGEKISCISSIFRLYKTKHLKEIDLNPTPTPKGGFSINAEILAKLLFKNCRFIEIPVPLTVREYGESKINNLREIVTQLGLVSKIFWWRITKS